MPRKVNLEKVRASLSILIAFLSLLQTAFATSVVTLIDHKHHRIVIGADSLISGTNGSRQECKIIETQDCVFVAAGTYYLKETNFHLLELAKTACGHPGGIEAKADEFLRIARTPVDKTAQYIRTRNPALFREEVANPNKGYIDVMFAGLNAFGLVEVSSRSFTVDAAGTLKSNSLDQHDVPPDPTFAMFAGVREDIDVYLKEHKNVWYVMDYAEIAKTLPNRTLLAHQFRFWK
ncbi:MAG TPA: hypothetical protein VK763_06835 [Terriglobales bacterium]|nr:hypothetical protein [Terriglobales bacterium]